MSEYVAVLFKISLRIPIALLAVILVGSVEPVYSTYPGSGGLLAPVYSSLEHPVTIIVVAASSETNSPRMYEWKNV
jgi:hypothetical protein